MSFVTIKKYLDAEAEAADASRNPRAEWPAFVVGLVQSVKSSVMAGEEDSETRLKLEALQSNLIQARDAGLLALGVEFDDVFQKFASEAAKRRSNREDELLKLFTILNEALVFANSNAERSSTFTTTLESSLKKAARTQDVGSIHRHLSEMLTLVRAEVKHQKEKGSDELASINRQVRHARTTILVPREKLGSREDAVSVLDAALSVPPSSGRWFTGLFVVERLRTIRARYGDEVVAELLAELVRKRLKQIGGGAQAFSWTPESILVLFTNEKDRGDVRDEVSTKVRGPFEHRAQLGIRSAALSVELRWVVSPVEGPLNDNVWAADRFVEGR